MKYIPKLFNTDMVQALKARTKTQTRRTQGLEIVNQDEINKWEFVGMGKDDENEKSLAVFKAIGYDHTWAECPLPAEPGDILWVRETSFSGYLLDENGQVPDNPETAYWYFADCKDKRPFDASDGWCMNEYGSDKSLWPKWKPSIFMPRQACRLWLKITNLRVERLQDITEADAKAEGVLTKPYGSHPFFCTIDYTYPPQRGGFRPGFCAYTGKQYRSSYETLWQSINGKDSWAANPFVWVYHFEVLTTRPEGFL